jgi:predicted transport protein
MEEIIAEVYEYSKYFTRMVLSLEKDPELKSCFEDIKTLEVNVVYPFLLEVYHDYEQQKLSRDHFVAILKLIESYVFRRFICGMYATGLNKIFTTLAKEIDKDHYLESVQAIFLQRSAGARFPRDEEFQAAFVVKDVYNFRNRQYLLSKLENYQRTVFVHIGDYTVEHILPQNKNLSPEWQQELGPNWQEVQARYLHTIGNLTLTGADYNVSMRDRPFKEKRQVDFGLTQSGLQLNTSLAYLEHWNAQEIERRAQILSDIAIHIWTIPILSLEQIQKYGRRIQKAPLAEVVGPVDHSLAGFVPAGYRILPANEKRFHYHRLINGEWVPYGNGRDAWYANSWERAGKAIREMARKNEKPLGVGGEIDPRYSRRTGYEHGEQNGDDPNDKTTYTIESYPYLQGAIYSLFESLRKRILNLDLLVREEYKKLYIAYKTTTNFVDIEPHKSFLKLALNMSFDEIDDPKNLCKDVTAVGHHGNGDVEVHLSSSDQLDDVMELVRQAFEAHWEEGAV